MDLGCDIISIAYIWIFDLARWVSVSTVTFHSTVNHMSELYSDEKVLCLDLYPSNTMVFSARNRDTWIWRSNITLLYINVI